MPEHAARIAVLILDRPLCLGCIAVSAGLSGIGVEDYLEKMEPMIIVHHARNEPCRACGAVVGNVFSIARKE